MAEINIRNKVLGQIQENRKEIIEFLRKLVSIPSITGYEKEIQEIIAEKLRYMGLSVDMWEPNINELKKHPGYVSVLDDYRDRPNVVGVLNGEGSGKSLLLNGHVDVIPPGPLNSWRYDPWSGKIVEDRIYGRGSSDMKSGLATMTMALDAIINSEISLKGDVIVEYTVDEELSGNGTLACVLRGYEAEAGICCETSSLRVQPASIGRIWFEIFVHGKPAGIQRRWEGVNAIDKGYRLVEAVATFEDIRVNDMAINHPLYPDKIEALPCMVGVFQAGSYPSSFPDTCHLKGSIATLPGEDSKDVKEIFINYIRTVSRTDSWLKKHPPQVKFTGYFAEPSEIPINHPIVETVASNFEEFTGTSPIVSGRLGAADTRFLNNYGRTPTVIFGPGLTEQMHATNEYVRIPDLVTATKVLAMTILDWCGYV
ncbi:MAG: ArgE/DapE family deacylase [Nitrososphaeria archaeon]|nr:ArgE/DapE family deacylase [Nitrososphaeria archaeon]NIQ32299.1 ArgE/DapE family deacylase [Nitrososphaeria archaeon]